MKSLLILAGLSACTPQDVLKSGGLDSGPAADSGLPSAWDTAPAVHLTDDTAAPPDWGCTTGTSINPREIPAPVDHSEGHRYRVVEVQTDAFEAYHIVVLFPPSSYRDLYDAGAPVIVTSMQSIGIGQAWVTEPRSFFPLEFGVVEVQPVHPGWVAVGSTTPGVHDGAGPQTADSLHEAIRFATGESTTTTGLSLRDLVNREICNGRVAVLGASSGGITAATALDRHLETMRSRVLGLAFYETPSLPMFVVADTGFKALDRWPTVDTDGNGIPWDEGRNPAFEGCDLTSLECSLDLDTLAWTGLVSPAEIAPTDFAVGASGVLYLDRNDNGRLDLAPDGHPDTDGDGLIGPEEDYFLLPYQDLHTSSAERQLYSPGVALAADALFGPGGRPTHLASAPDAAAYWSDRDAVEAVTRAVEQGVSDLHFTVAFSEEDHAIPVAERPHIGLLHAALLQAGATVRTNLDREAALCLVGEEVIGDWAGGSAPGTPLETAELQTQALPGGLPPRTGRALATLGLFWDMWGPFDSCPGGLSSR